MSDRFPARRSRGGDLALPVAGILLFVALAALVLGVTREPSAAMLALCVASAILAAAGVILLMWALAYRRLSYALTESALRVEWLGRSLVVPYPAVQGIYGGQRLSGNSSTSLPHWPGINVGPARLRGMGRVRFYATSSDQSLLTLITVEHGALVISAQHPAEFQSALIEHVERYEASMATESQLPASWEHREPKDAPWTAVADVWFRVCLAIGTLIALIGLANIALRYAALPAQLPLHFDAVGQTTQIAPKSDLLHLPLLGLLCLLVNWSIGAWVHPRERVLGRLLWLGAIVVQLVLLIAVQRLVG